MTSWPASSGSNACSVRARWASSWPPHARPVGLKARLPSGLFLLPEALVNADAVARFAREARAAVKIKSEHVARVSDVGTLDSGSPYMVMEYLQGQDLSDWMRDRGTLSVPDAVEFLLQACEALAEACTREIGIRVLCTGI